MKSEIRSEDSSVARGAGGGSLRAATLCAALLALFAGMPSAQQADRREAATANPNALPDAKAILRYFRALPERKEARLISGQFEGGGALVRSLSHESNHLAVVRAATGRWVGIAGVTFYGGDFPNDRASDLCLEYWNRGGLVQVYLLLSNPANPLTESRGPNMYGTCDLERVLDSNDAFHSFFLRDLDRAAIHLAALQKSGVIVMLNPLAEISGKWFWWGNGPAEIRIRLFRFMFDYLTRAKHLDNLLFIFEPSSAHPDAHLYYPGDACVDLVGLSCFVASSEELKRETIPAYPQLKALGKPLCLSQWGPRRGKDQTKKADQDPADNMKLIRGVEQAFPEIIWWMSWRVAYSISAAQNGNFHDSELLRHPRVVNLDTLDWKAFR